MKTRHITLAATLLSLAGLVSAQQAPSTNKPDPGAATSTGTSTSQSEMNRGVPGVNVDVGRNASGAVDVQVDKNTSARNLGTDASGSATDAPPTRAARADRG
jgi:hypothetical protein